MVVKKDKNFILWTENSDWVLKKCLIDTIMKLFADQSDQSDLLARCILTLRNMYVNYAVKPSGSVPKRDDIWRIRSAQSCRTHRSINWSWLSGNLYISSSFGRNSFLLKCIPWKRLLLMLGTIVLYETECYCALLVETTCCIMLKHGLKLGNRIIMTYGNKTAN